MKESVLCTRGLVVHHLERYPPHLGTPFLQWIKIEYTLSDGVLFLADINMLKKDCYDSNCVSELESKVARLPLSVGGQIKVTYHISWWHLLRNGDRYRFIFAGEFLLYYKLLKACHSKINKRERKNRRLNYTVVTFPFIYINIQSKCSGKWCFQDNSMSLNNNGVM